MEEPRKGGGDERSERREFVDHLFVFMKERSTPITFIPIFDHKELDLYRLYKGVTSRGGLANVVESKLWRQITNELGVDQDRTDAGFRLRMHYMKYLYPYERKYFLGLEDDIPNDFGTPSTTGASRLGPVRTNRRGKKRSSLCDEPANVISVDFSKLEVAALKRYLRYFRLRWGKNTSKPEMAETVLHHFVHHEIDESIVIDSFLNSIRGNGSGSPVSQDDAEQLPSRRRRYPAVPTLA